MSAFYHSMLSCQANRMIVLAFLSIPRYYGFIMAANKIVLGKKVEPIRLRIPILRWNFERKIYIPVAGETVLVQVEHEGQISEVRKRIEAALQIV